MNTADFWGEPISRYTRAQALADGVLVDATATAKECGFKWPVALTAAAWAACVTVPPGVVLQDEQGRLRDVLVMLLYAIRAARSDGQEIRFGVHKRRGLLLLSAASEGGPNRCCQSRRISFFSASESRGPAS